MSDLTNQISQQIWLNSSDAQRVRELQNRSDRVIRTGLRYNSNIVNTREGQRAAQGDAATREAFLDRPFSRSTYMGLTNG